MSGGSGDLRDPEIQDLHLTRAQDEDVRGLDVAMHDALLVSVVKPFTHLPHDVELVLQGQLRLPGDD